MASSNWRAFRRYWWKPNKDSPGGREPALGNKQHLQYFDTKKEARDYCIEWNKGRRPGRTGIKAEFESC